MAFNSGASSGNLVLLSSQTVSGSAGITFTSVITSKYSDYVLRCSGVTPAGGAGVLNLRFSVDNGANWLGGANYTRTGYATFVGAGVFYGDVGNTSAYVCATIVTQASSICNFFSLASSTLIPMMIGNSLGVDTGRQDTFGWQYDSAITVNAIQLFPDAGTFSGSFKLYGVQK